MDSIVQFATYSFPYAAEFQAIGMAFQGAMAVRSGPNKNGTLHWFHAFVLSVMAAFTGGWLGFIWMGKPSSMLSNDVNFASCIFAFVVVNYTPGDIGYMICRTLPVTLVITSSAQLFRASGIMKFVAACYDAFKDNPSPYYPIPVFGPILYGTLLGNMAGFLMKGLEGHVSKGMPWPVQNGLFCATFYHFFVHDSSGPVGTFLRTSIPARQFGLKDVEFASCVVTYFMQLVGILQLPEFLGPSWSPFNLFHWKGSSSGERRSGSEHKKQTAIDEGDAPTNGGKSKKPKQKKAKNKMKTN
ncbi:hypothetical protein FisN_5Lh352 [Fistulifera solaris]|uniref:Uncharacterized protein n=1 Tax=Fistulifera solaris TaxID=1519565 RepID=A0A1Z5KH23_FISSO|nr:hypothetical protein FisN_5Lh352 [Fistulifera solaris]|eukprot:GAX25268.1 hypothetical protein FisN_5Lh352 [Fistulifera solaris]